MIHAMGKSREIAFVGVNPDMAKEPILVGPQWSR
jgi:hypothetical protein